MSKFDYPGSAEEIQKIFENTGLKPGDPGYYSALSALRDKIIENATAQYGLIRPDNISYRFTDTGVSKRIEYTDADDEESLKYFAETAKILGKRLEQKVLMDGSYEGWIKEQQDRIIKQEEERILQQKKNDISIPRNVSYVMIPNNTTAGATVSISLGNDYFQRGEIKINCGVLNCKNIRQDRTCGKIYSEITMDEMGGCVYGQAYVQESRISSSLSDPPVLGEVNKPQDVIREPIRRGRREL